MRIFISAAIFLGVAYIGQLFGQSPTDSDVALLNSAKVDAQPAALVAYFDKMSLAPGEETAVREMIAKLGSATFSERTLTAKALEERGPAVLPLLRASLSNSDIEVTRRAEAIIKLLEAKIQPDLMVSAARVLAKSRHESGVAALFRFLPQAEDAWGREEILASIGSLSIRAEKIEPKFLEYLRNGQPSERAAAAFLLGQRGDFERRAMVRKLLADPAPEVREQAGLGLVGKRAPIVLRDAQPSDLALAKGNKLTETEVSLLDFLRSRTLSDEDRRRMEQWVRDLGNSNFKIRYDASRNLVQRSSPALPFLARASENSDIEVSRRALLCMEEIQRGPGPALPLAVLRLLAQTSKPSPATAIRVILDYLPFADDESVEEEALNTLCFLSIGEEALDPLLRDGLTDEQPARRAGVAWVLGRVGSKEHQTTLRDLLKDPDPQVRHRAALGLVAAHDASGVASLVEQIKEGPVKNLFRVEEQLLRLAGEQAPATGMDERAKSYQAWSKWWQTSAGRIDLTQSVDGPSHMGLYTICEYDSVVGRPGGQVWEAARDGKPRWRVQNLQGAMDAQVLPNGRVLIAENSTQRVTERDPSGAIHWEYKVQANPVCCQRLANGNTFIACYNQLLEVTPDKRVVWNYQRGNNFFVFCAHRLRNGNVVCINAQGQILEIDPKANKEIRTVNLGIPNGGWCGVEALPNGRYLVATMNTNQVLEVDATGKQHWKATFQGVFRATRLPNGQTMVASMTTRKVAMLDRNGAVTWEKTCDGRPWSVHYR